MCSSSAVKNYYSVCLDLADGSESLGFGDLYHSKFFDYGDAQVQQLCMNNVKFDGGQLSASEKNHAAFMLKWRKYQPFTQQCSALICQ